MTIRTQNKASHSFSLAVIALVFAIIGSAAGTVLLYNRVVDAQHTLANLQTQKDNDSIQNANLKQDILAQRSSASLQALAQERNLIKDEHPLYLTAEGIQ